MIQCKKFRFYMDEQNTENTLSKIFTQSTFKKKTCKQESLNLLTYGDSSTDTKTDRNGHKRREKMSGVMCQASRVTCHKSCVACHLSLLPTATATDPPPADSPTMHNRLVLKDQTTQTIKNSKSHQNRKTTKISRSMPTLLICSLTRSVLSTRKQVSKHGRQADGQCN